MKSPPRKKCLLISSLQHSHLIDCTWQLHLGALCLGFKSGLRAIKTIKQKIQEQSQRLIFSQFTYYSSNLKEL